MVGLLVTMEGLLAAGPNGLLASSSVIDVAAAASKPKEELAALRACASLL